MIRTARLKAYAKLNLGLRVLYKRPDGYHELRTIFQTVSLCDRLDVGFRRARATRIEVSGAPGIPDNLVVRAAHVVLEALKISADVSFSLYKNIPAGAGLGGGSSDAAAVLLSLPVLAGIDLSMEQLSEMAAALGSDVPFFLYGGTALGFGRGEELYPLPDRRGVRALLVAPEIHSSTAEAFRDLSPRLTTIPLQNKLFSFQQEVWLQGTAGAVNDFEEGVFGRHPHLLRIRNRLRRFGATPAAMTGSGSAIFGVFADPAKLARARQSFMGDKTFAISFLSRSEYRRSWQRALKCHTKGDLWPPRSLYAR